MALYDSLVCSDKITIPSSGNPFFRVLATTGTTVGRDMMMCVDVDDAERVKIPIIRFTGPSTVFIVWVLDRKIFKYSMYGEFVEFLAEGLVSNTYDDTVFECCDDEQPGKYQVLDVYQISGKLVTKRGYHSRMDAFMNTVAADIPLNLASYEPTTRSSTPAYYSVSTGAMEPLLRVAITKNLTKRTMKVIKKAKVDHYITEDGDVISVRGICESINLARLFDKMDIDDFLYLLCTYDYSMMHWRVTV